MTEFTYNNIYPFAHCIIQHYFRLSDCLLLSQATPFTDEICETIIERAQSCCNDDLEELFFALFAAILQI